MHTQESQSIICQPLGTAAGSIGCTKCVDARGPTIIHKGSTRKAETIIVLVLVSAVGVWVRIYESWVTFHTTSTTALDINSLHLKTSVIYYLYSIYYNYSLFK